MNSEERIDTIPSSWEETCASEPLHIIGTVQSYGFLMVVDIGSGKIVQVSSGIAAHWPGLAAATALLDTPLSSWVGGTDPAAPSDLASLSASHPVVLGLRPCLKRPIRRRKRGRRRAGNAWRTAAVPGPCSNGCPEKTATMNYGANRKYSTVSARPCGVCATPKSCVLFLTSACRSFKNSANSTAS